MQMMKLVTAITLLATASKVAFVTSSSLLPLGSFIAPAGYAIVNATFCGTYNGNDYSLQGTASQVDDQLEALYGRPPPPQITNEVREVEAGVRNSRNKDGVHCIPVKRQGWVKGSYDDVNGTIARLKARTGSDRAVNIAGRSCARIACWLSTGITLCNDNVYEIAPQAEYLASYAQDLVDECSNSEADPTASGGQEFNTDHYNVILSGMWS